jgi:cytochrome c5
MRRTLFALSGLAILAAIWIAPAGAQVTRRQVTLPKGPERRVILASCTICHGLDVYATKALDRAGWNEIIETMKTKGAEINAEDTSILLDYLVGSFGPGSMPAPVAALEPLEPAQEARAKEVLETACTTCHNLQRVEAQSQPEDGWENIIANMRNRGSSMTDEEAALVVSYLVRAYGPK